MTEAELPIYVLVWTACAVVAWFIANAKKAPDAGTWALAGLLLGPFGILAAIAFAKPRTAPSNRICPRCKHVNFGQSPTCSNCGLPFAETVGRV